MQPVGFVPQFARQAPRFGKQYSVVTVETHSSLVNMYREDLKHLFEKQGDTLEVLNFRAPGKAQAYLQKNAVDAVITEIMLPNEEDGLAFLRSINDLPKKPFTIVSTTRRLTEADIAASRADKFVVKHHTGKKCLQDVLFDYLKEAFDQLQPAS